MPRIHWCEIKGWRQPTKLSNWLANIRKYLKGFSSCVSAGGWAQQIHRPTPQTKQCASIYLCNTLPRLGTSCLATVFILFYPCLYILNVLTVLCCLVTASKCVWGIMVTAAKFLRALLILELVQPAWTYKCKWYGTSEYSRHAAGSTSCRRLASPQSVKGCNVTTPNHEETSREKRKERRYKVPCGVAMQQTAGNLHYSSTRSLNNKIDELRIYAEANFECCESETWLRQDLTLFVSWKNFLAYALTGVWCQGKTRAGACVFITNNCWSQYRLHKTVSKPNIKLVCLSLRPFYLPRKLGNIIPNPMTTLRAPVFILGGFNHFTQVFNCMLNLRPDRRKYWLNVVKWTVDRSKAKSPLSPLMKLLSKGMRSQVKTVNVWMKDSIKSLGVFFFFSTECNIFHEMDMDTAAETVTDNIKYGMDNVMPETEVTVFPNNKPYITEEVKNCINHNKNCI